MPGLGFVSNLRPQSIASFEGGGFAPSAWLLSTHRLTAETQRYALAIRETGIDLFADNGTKPSIDAVATLHQLSAGPVVADWAALQATDPTSTPSATLRSQANDVAKAICDDVDRFLRARPVDQVIEEQLQMQPTHIFAQEDFAIAVLTKLGLDRQLLGWDLDAYISRNERTMRRWRRTAQDPRCRGKTIYAVLSAVDYSTAVAAGRLAARYGTDAIAYGFAGPNSDTSWTDTIDLGDTRVTLPKRAPTKYARLPALLGGFVEGMAAGKQTLRHFHALGCGAAPQFPVLLATMPSWTTVTTDATSPLMDAIKDLVHYHPEIEEWAARITVIEGATSVLAGDDWPCTCTFCSYIKTRFGWDPAGARRIIATREPQSLSLEDLTPEAPIGSALPIFATSRDSTAGPMSRCRVGHNHWTFENLCTAIPSTRRRDWAQAQIAGLITTRTGSVQAGLIAVQAVTQALSQHNRAPRETHP